MATNTARLQRILLQWETDQQKLRATIAGAKQVSNELKQTGDVTARATVQAKGLKAEFDQIAKQRAITQLARDFAAARASGQNLTATVNATKTALRQMNAEQSDLRQFASEATRFADELERANRASALSGGGRLQGGALGRIGSELRLLPSFPIPGTGVGTDSIANTLRIAGAGNRIINDLGISLGQLAAAGGIAGAALVAVGLAFSAFTAEIERQRAAIRAIIDVNRERYLAERTLTTQQAQERLAQYQAELDAARRTRDDVLRSAEEAREGAKSVFGGILEAAALTPAGIPLRGAAVQEQLLNAVGDALTGLGGDLSEAETALLEAQTAVDSWTRSIGENAFAVQDAEEFQRRVAQERVADILAEASRIQQNAAQGLQYSQFTEAQARAELERLRTERSGIANAMDSLIASGDQSEAVVAQQAALTRSYIEAAEDIKRLVDEYLPLAIERDREIQALKDMVKASEELNKARAKVQDAEADLAQAHADNAAAIAKIDADLVDKRFEIDRKAQLAADEAELDAEQGRVKAVEDAGKKRVEAEKKANDDLLKAQRQYNRDFGNAVANRDALAALEAQQKYDDEKADIKSALKDQKQEIEDGYREQLKVVDARLRDQLRVIEQRKGEELRLAKKAADAALVIEAQKHTAEIQMRQQALNAAVQQYVMFISQLNAAVGSYNGGQIYLPQVIDLPPVQNQQQAYQQFLAYQRSQIPNYETGLDYVPRNRYLNFADEGEAILNKQDARVWREWKTSGGSKAANMRLSIDGPALSKLMRGQAVNVVAEVVA